MNYLFKKDLLDDLRETFKCDVFETTQDYVKEMMTDLEDNFPMISHEHTEDSNIEVSMDESKFLNDPSHEGCWIVVGDEDSPLCIMNLKENGKDTLEIDTLEVSVENRKKNIGVNAVTSIEFTVEGYYDYIIISPFDTSAFNFWKGIGFKNMGNGNLFIEV